VRILTDLRTRFSVLKSVVVVSIVVVPVALWLAPSSATTTRTQTTFTSPETTSCQGHVHRHGVDEFKVVARKAYDDWKRKPREAQERQMEHYLHCHRPNTRGRMKRILHRQKSNWKSERKYQRLIDPPGASYLAGLRQCESGGNYRTNTGNGFYGAYQFDLQTWYSVGGSGRPDQASPREQDIRAAKLWRSRGSQPWPVCGREG
jgi:lipopolysaccharide export LptBFGC system permease protein LptF